MSKCWVSFDDKNTNTKSVQVLGIWEMYYFQMERSLGGKEEGLDKVAEDRLSQFLFILCSETIQQKMGRNAWMLVKKTKAIRRQSFTLKWRLLFLMFSLFLIFISAFLFIFNFLGDLIWG